MILRWHDLQAGCNCRLASASFRFRKTFRKGPERQRLVQCEEILPFSAYKKYGANWAGLMFVKRLVPLIGLQRLKHLNCRRASPVAEMTFSLSPLKHQMHILQGSRVLQAFAIRNYSGTVRPHHTGAGSIENRRVSVVG